MTMVRLVSYVRRTANELQLQRTLTLNLAIVVLGYHDHGTEEHAISAICRAGVRRAEALAADPRTRAAIFTGWSFDGGPTEADQMLDVWNGRPDIDLIREPKAENTAENAVRSLQIVRDLGEIDEVLVVCSIPHLPRVRFFFDRLYRRFGYEIGYRTVGWPIPPPARLLHEGSSVTRMRADRRTALRLLREADAA
jgi:uncharacterized SAM-binding protein YcdF (DUF218 family)